MGLMEILWSKVFHFKTSEVLGKQGYIGHPTCFRGAQRKSSKDMGLAGVMAVALNMDRA
jgi:hypothetical protein